jgi:hypothetical protein
VIATFHILDLSAAKILHHSGCARPPLGYWRWNSAGFDVRLAFHLSLEILAVIHFLWFKKLSSVAICRDIDSVSGAAVIGLRAIQKWTHPFDEGDASLED